ncbi:MAG: glucose-6-phosphate 1-dehydrogenase [Cyanobacteria bacterium RYN_339]|nr:glucose-6-phosphate 1-dehydrogenase [Cyanobacteria bacterium RYN_339]
MSTRTPAHPRTSADTERLKLQPCTLVLFGASGDLAHRMVVPALFRLWRRGLLAPGFRLVGYARTKLDDAAFRDGMRKAVLEKARPGDEEAWPAFAERLGYITGQYEGDQAGYRQLAELFGQADESGATARRLFYLALPPKEFAPVIRQLAEAKLLGRSYQAPTDGWSRVIVEKPFGRDLASARELNAAIARDVDEHFVYRIDHYLGKEAAQNLFTLRFGNALFEPVWNRNYIDHVQITAAETLGVEGRGGYYETAGAMRDMVQNHLMQLMALVAIEPPDRWTSTAVRNEKVQVLQAVQRLEEDAICRDAVRGQYGPGTIDGAPVPGYRQEPGVDPHSMVETYAGLRLHIDNLRWAGVPFYLRAGKRLAARRTEIAIQFKPAPHTPFPVPDDAGGANTLVVEFAPNERLTLRVAGKAPGRGMLVTPVELAYCGASSGEKPPSAYENLLVDALVGDPTFFARADEVEASWAIIDPVLHHWEHEPELRFPNYESGSQGPLEGDAMVQRDERPWRDLA